MSPPFSPRVILFGILTFTLFLQAQAGTKHCDEINDCSNCTKFSNISCVWCTSSEYQGCYDVDDLNSTMVAACDSLLSGEKDKKKCDLCSADELYPCSHGIVGQVLLMALYAIVLAYGAKLISDGSELLLEILDPGVIGGLVLPVMGAVPDAAIIVVSGINGSREEAARQISVGVGTLAGSTIMLLTIPWFASMILARCDLRNGRAIDGRCNGFSFTKQGITVDDDTPVNARIMVVVSCAYLIIQGDAFLYVHSDDASSHEHYVALATSIVCFILLVAYSVYQIVNPRLQAAKMKEARRTHLMKQSVHAFLQRLQHVQSAATIDENSPILPLVQEESQVDVGAAGHKWLAQARKAKEDKGETIQNDSDEEDEEDDTPKSPFRIALKSVVLLVIGTGLVAVFSDPMVEVIDDFGHSINVNAFYISFIVTPFCSNASEFISSLIFAAKKKKRNTSLTYSQLYGAATMNASMCLCIFCALIYQRRLAWTFTAETLSILVVTMIVGAISAFKTTFKVWWGFVVVLLYPLSLAFVWVLENKVGLD